MEERRKCNHEPNSRSRPSLEGKWMHTNLDDERKAMIDVPEVSADSRSRCRRRKYLNSACTFERTTTT